MVLKPYKIGMLLRLHAPAGTLNALLTLKSENRMGFPDKKLTPHFSVNYLSLVNYLSQTGTSLPPTLKGDIASGGDKMYAITRFRP